MGCADDEVPALRGQLFCALRAGLHLARLHARDAGAARWQERRARALPIPAREAMGGVDWARTMIDRIDGVERLAARSS